MIKLKIEIINKMNKKQTNKVNPGHHGLLVLFGLLHKKKLKIIQAKI